MTGESVSSIILSIIMVSLFTTLLYIKRINQPTYVILISLTALVSLVLHGFPRLKELDVKSLKLTLAEIHQVRDDVYAKAESVATLAAFLVDASYSPTPYSKTSVLKSNETVAVEILSSSGVSTSIINSVRAKYARAIAGSILQRLGNKSEMLDMPSDYIDVDFYERSEIEEWCTDNGINAEPFRKYLDEADYHLIRANNLNN